MSNKIAVVAWREFKQTVFRPVFLIAVLGMPILILGVMVLAFGLMVTQKQPPLIGSITIVTASSAVVEAATDEFSERALRQAELEEREQAAEEMTEDIKEGRFGMGTSAPAQRGEVRITVEHATADQSMENLKAKIRSEDTLALAVIDPDVLDTPGPEIEDKDRPKLQLWVPEGMDSDHVSLIERTLGRAVVRVRADREGLDPTFAMSMLQAPESATSRALKDGTETGESEGIREARRMIVPMAFMMLIWIGAFTSGQHLMMSTIEEKSNRVMEVLLSAVSPMQLMTGKILGHGGVGLLIVGIYSSTAVAALIVLAAFSDWLNVMDLVYLGVYYFMAYFMVAAMMAAVGSAVSDIREANTLVTPVMMILMVPLMLWMPISQAPNGMVATIFSFVPPAIPFSMILRVAAEEPVPMWQIAASVVWGYICVIGMVWGAAKIFRVGTLMYGKPPSPIELIKWLRYS